jgi:hypothetical protein
LEAQIIEKRLSANVNGVHINLLLPFQTIERLISPRGDKTPFTDDVVKKFSSENNKKNFLFELLNQTTFVIGGISGVNINLYTNIDTYLYNLNLRINEIGFSSLTVNEKAISRGVNITGLTMTMTTNTKDNGTEISEEKDIQVVLKHNQNVFTESIINDITMTIGLSAFNYRFERSTIDILDIEEKDKNEFLANFENFGHNINIDLFIKKCDIVLNQIVIKDCFKIYYYLQHMKYMNKLKYKNAQEMFTRAFYSLKKTRTLRSNDDEYNYFDQFIGSAAGLNKSKLMNLTCYLFVQLALKGYTNGLNNYYMLIRLALKFKNIIGEDYKILDYLIEKHIHLFDEAKSNLKVDSIFIDTDLIESLKNKSQNSALKEFIFFIIDKYSEIKKLMFDNSSYDDFIRLNVKFEKFTVSLNKSFFTDDKVDTSIISSLNYVRDKIQNRQPHIDDIKFSNQLVRLEITNINSSIYTNAKEYIFVKLNIGSILLWDISYRNIPGEIHKRYFPILKIQYDTEINFFRIKNNIHSITVHLPTIFTCIDAYCLFFINIFLQKIKIDLEKFIESKEYHEYLNRDEEPLNTSSDLDSYASSTYGVYGLRNTYRDNIQRVEEEDGIRILHFGLKITRVILNFSYTEYLPNKSSLVFNVNFIEYDFDRSRQTSKVSLDEIIGGSVKNDSIIQFLNNSRNLSFETNILNLFGLVFPIDYSRIQKHCEVSFFLPEIYIKLDKNDINLIQKNIFDSNKLISLRKDYEHNFKSGEADLSLTLLRMNSTKKKTKSGVVHKPDSFFYLSIGVKKIVIQATLDDDERNLKLKNFIYRHLILVVDNINIYSYTSKINNDVMLTFRRFVTILRFFDLSKKNEINFNAQNIKFEKKLFEINSRPIEQNLLNLKDYMEAKAGRKFEKIENLFYHGMIGKKNNTKQYIVFKTNPVYIGFDHVLLSYIIDNFQLKKNEFYQNLDAQVDNLMDDLITRERRTSMINFRRSFTEGMTKDRSSSSLSVKISQIRIETFIENKTFLTMETENFQVKNEDKKGHNLYKISTDLKYIIDDRDISKNNKFIIFNNEVKVNIELSDTFIDIKLANPKYVFLNRILMDMIEYVYFIVYKEVIMQISYEEVYSKSPEEIVETVKNTYESDEDEEEGSKDIHFIHKCGDRPSLNRRKCLKTVSAFQKNGIKLEESPERRRSKQQQIPFQITLTVTNGEVLIAMNSLKNSNKAILKFNKLELVNYSRDFDRIIQLLRYKLQNLDKKIQNQSSEPPHKLDFFIRVEDAKLIHSISENNIDDIARFSPKDNGQFYEEKELGCINIALDLSSDYKYLSLTKVYVILPFLKLRMFSDVYEKILRIFFENLWENPLVRSKGSILGDIYFRNNNIDMTYCEVYVLVDDFVASVYNFPSSCMLHKDKRDMWFHDNTFKCKTSKMKGNIQLTKLCTIRLRNFCLVMNLKNNSEKITFMEFDSIVCELNKFHLSFNKLQSNILLNSIDRTKKAFFSEILLRRGNQYVYNLEFFNIDVNFLRLPIIALYRFFAKYFFYYQNKNIRMVNYGEIKHKEMTINLNNFTFFIQSNNVEINRGTYYELDILTDLKFIMRNKGNALLGPIEDLKIYELFIKEIYLCDMKHRGGKDRNTYKNQICSEVFILFNILTRATDRLQPENTFYYLFGEINKHGTSVLNNFIYKDPREYKTYIKEYVYRERDLLERELGKDIKGVVYPTFRISLNILQLTYIHKIINDLQTYDKENYYNILYCDEKSSYDKILFNCFYSFYIKELQLEITDYQFNSKLFQVTVENLLSYITNYPNSEELQEYAEEIENKNFNLYKTNKSERKKHSMMQSHKGSLIFPNQDPSADNKSNIYSMIHQSALNHLTDPIEEEKQYSLDSLSKFIIRVYYHNTNNKTWEPLTEPLPASISFFRGSDKQYLHFHLLSLQQNDLGIENICRQKNFHSLNINLNEFIFESIRAMITDYQVLQDKQLVSLNLDQTKQLVVRNFTEYKINIEENEGFLKDMNEDNDNTRVTYIYNKDKTIDYKENISVGFNTDEKHKKKDNSLQFYGDTSMKRIKSTIDNQTLEQNILDDFQGDAYNSHSHFYFNIEKASKVFSIFNETGKRYKKQEIEEELSKNLHSNKKILLPGERFLVTEITINNQKNKKSVSFRSNEGIKNELDFPLKVKFIFRDNVNVNSMYENSIIILPGCIFYIPNNIIEKVKEVEFTPFLYANEIRFHPTRCNIQSLESENETEDNIDILVFFLKGSKSDEENMILPYFDHIVCSIVKKYEVAENEYIDNNIKKRIELMKNLSDFKESGNDKIADNESTMDDILRDYTYVLTPVMKFYNSLPRNILITKMLPRDILTNTRRTKNKDYEELRNYLDIEAICNRSSDFYKDEFTKLREFSNLLPQDYYTTWGEGDYEYFSDRRKEVLKSFKGNVNIDDGVRIKANGGYLAIYEPFLFKEKYAKCLQFKIATEEWESTQYLNERNSKKIMRRKTGLGAITDKSEVKVKRYYDKFTLFPFKLRSLLKSLHENMSIEDVDRSKLKFFTFNFKHDYKEPISIKSKKNNYENLNYTIEMDDNNKILKTYLYCPYLFINTTDMKLHLEYRSVKTNELLNESRSIGKKEEELDDEILERITMFYPRKRNKFSFHLSTKNAKTKMSVDVLEIANIGIVAELFPTSTVNNTVQQMNYSRVETVIDFNDDIDDKENRLSRLGTLHKTSNITDEEKRIQVSLQMAALKNALKWSKLIYITPMIYIKNTTERDIWILHFSKKRSNKDIKVNVVRAGETLKFYFLQNYFEYIKISFEERLNPDDTFLYSGLIRFIPNTEFYVELGEREKETKTLLFVKVYKEQGFLYVLIKQKGSPAERSMYPYIIVNKLHNRGIKYRQKENMDTQMKDFFEANNIKPNIMERNLPEEFEERNICIEPPTVTYTWDEPFMHAKGNRNVLEVVFFGSKFEIDMDDIHEDIRFIDRSRTNEDLFSRSDHVKSTGTVRVKEGLTTKEYHYTLYEFGLFLKNKEEMGELKVGELKFEFYDKDLAFYRKNNGRIILKKNKDYEIYCVSDEDTNDLAGQIYKLKEKARSFVKSLIIKKYVLNKSIYLEIGQRTIHNKELDKSKEMVFVTNIDNVSVSFIQKNEEFMYLWLNELSLAFRKTGEVYKNLTLRLKDYQIDNYLKNSRYPIVLSPLSDKSDTDYYNLDIEITDFKYSDHFTQIDKIFILLSSVDLRLEFKFIEQIYSFIQLAKKNFQPMGSEHNKKTFRVIINDIDRCNFMGESNKLSDESLLLLKQILIPDIKICFSLKFENIDIFLSQTSFLFIKPLIEELGLKILNMDAAMFNFLPFMKFNIFQSTDEFLNIVSTFYNNQFISELVKSLGGISSITSMQIVESLNQNIFLNMRMEKNQIVRVERNNKKGRIREFVIISD